jgi:hypothetical protein
MRIGQIRTLLMARKARPEWLKRRPTKAGGDGKHD